jgi:hypothetical protein
MGGWHARSSSLAAVALVTLALLCGGAAAPAAATLLSPRFAVNGGAESTRWARVTIGDEGWSPFFGPGVVVWDGGSVIGGYGTSPGMDFPTQTLRLVPHPVTSIGSVTPAALLEDMLAEGSREVDAWYLADADANICVVMGGAQELRWGRDPSAVHDDLVTYCLGRRTAGFKVIVVTLLPRFEPSAYEDARQTFNGLVRATWTAYADGVADIAADRRIGDYLDCCDLQYYQLGAVHPNDAGDAVMAAVTAPVLNRLSWRSSACEIRVRSAGGGWSAWRPYAAGLAWSLEVGDGVKTVEAEYRDGAGDVAAASDSIVLDTVPPVTRAPYAARARRGVLVTLHYRVVDAAPCGRLARKVTIRVRNAAGIIVRTLAVAQVPVNTTLGARFTVPWTWRAGVYTYAVYATDNAGNRQSKAGLNTLTVR